MRKAAYTSVAIILSILAGYSQVVPDAEAFTVIKKTPAYGPKITSLLRHQTALAWKQDDARRENLKNIKIKASLPRRPGVAEILVDG